MRKKDEKWYAIPPYQKNESWKICNENGEQVAVFEYREDCEAAVKAVNKEKEKEKEEESLGF